MTKNEFNQLIVKSTNPNWFSEKTEAFQFPNSDKLIELKGVSSIYEFVSQQAEGWRKITEPIPDQFKNSQKFFLDLKNSIESFVIERSQTHDLEIYWNNNISNSIRNKQQAVLRYDIPEIEFLLSIFKNYNESFSGAYNFIFKKDSLNFSGKDAAIGYLLAYEFQLKDYSHIIERRDAEKKSISNIRTDFQKYLSQTENQLVDHLLKANQEFDNYVEKIDSLKGEKESMFTEWFEERIVEHNHFRDSSKSEIKQLEETYNEKLKLEEPAKYWSDRGKALKQQGWISIWILVLLTAFTSYLLWEILVNAPETIYASFLGDDKSAAIRWSIVFVVFISFLAFCIKAVSKVMFSSFHLARDAEERHSLAYFYLALKKDDSIQDEDRKLIIQSLFSRSDTGLLKEDSSPTMPGEVMKIFGK
ncbi:hypothetical protein GVN16_21860 [Emticicia sp. CRIBPO]|uniref:DUF6161 domain-containing protein n=1 Tax=Emticicia sp. CRIBPO TaxID=2683258 RepID=UPI0014133B8D|nr:DUF6161 domain-containing protein [Emticicia sp. CRIBPO]NBA88435.1 hypothetical protein [Emticicia sp. CRIBPO]